MGWLARFNELLSGCCWCCCCYCYCCCKAAVARLRLPRCCCQAAGAKFLLPGCGATRLGTVSLKRSHQGGASPRRLFPRERPVKRSPQGRRFTWMPLPWGPFRLNAPPLGSRFAQTPLPWGAFRFNAAHQGGVRSWAYIKLKK